MAASTSPADGDKGMETSIVGIVALIVAILLGAGPLAVALVLALVLSARTVVSGG